MEREGKLNYKMGLFTLESGIDRTAVVIGVIILFILLFFHLLITLKNGMPLFG